MRFPVDIRETDSVSDLVLQVARHFERLADHLTQGREQLELVPQSAEPEKLYNGLLVYADGSNWNPGGGEGIYAYYAGQWNRLG